MKSAKQHKINEILANQSETSQDYQSDLSSDISSNTSPSVAKECPWRVPPTCDPDAEFRTIDGSCNNLEEPNWGQVGTPYQRLVNADYAPGTLDMPPMRVRIFPTKPSSYFCALLCNCLGALQIFNLIQPVVSYISR